MEVCQDNSCQKDKLVLDWTERHQVVHSNMIGKEINPTKKYFLLLGVYSGSQSSFSGCTAMFAIMFLCEQFP